MLGWIPSGGRILCATIPPRICCTPSCAWSWRACPPGRVAGSARPVYASTLPTRSPDTRRVAAYRDGCQSQYTGCYNLNIKYKSLQQAIGEGAMALFGEKYSETVRTITIGGAEPFSYELCGGTHVDETGDIGLFLITPKAARRRASAVSKLSLAEGLMS